MSNEPKLTFSNQNSRFNVLLDAVVMQTLLQHCTKAGRKETGGILIGNIDSKTGALTVTEATPKPRDSVFSWFSFQRGSDGLAQILAQRWHTGEHYVGEWHFHPGGSPQPSNPDIRAMRKIASDHQYQCKEPILLILGGWPGKNITTSVHVFPRDEAHVQLIGRKSAV